MTEALSIGNLARTLMRKERKVEEQEPQWVSVLRSAAITREPALFEKGDRVEVRNGGTSGNACWLPAVVTKTDGACEGHWQVRVYSVRYDSGNTQTYVMRTDVRACQESEKEKRERLRLTLLQTGFFNRWMSA